MPAASAMESTENAERLVKSFTSGRTLASQKKKLSQKARKVRNIIVNPTDNFWPILDDEENVQFRCVMTRAIKFYSIECNKKTKREWKKDLTFGTNETAAAAAAAAAAAQNDVIWAVILEDDVDSKIVNKYMVQLCASKGIIVLVVNSLRKLTKKLLGFSVITVGFKKNALTSFQENEPMNELCKLIQKLGEAHEPPEFYLNFRKTVPELSELKSAEPTPVIVSQNTGEQKCDKSNTLCHIYLLKPLSGRAFIPPSREEKILKEKSTEDFIPLSTGIMPDDKIEDESHYLPKAISCRFLNIKKPYEREEKVVTRSVSKLLKEKSTEDVIPLSTGIMPDNKIEDDPDYERKPSKLFLPLRYVQVQPKPKKKRGRRKKKKNDQKII